MLRFGVRTSCRHLKNLNKGSNNNNLVSKLKTINNNNNFKCVASVDLSFSKTKLHSENVIEGNSFQTNNVQTYEYSKYTASMPIVNLNGDVEQSFNRYNAITINDEDDDGG
eukprot:TRINITY_DN92024_c0_g1_i1.p1 TRINITY_DN92024_c0_g1~~TRINITY_DN92024_c0_g1_i1.p1  ORF type:complete len:111 (-),score=8.66 TRINITY_DN92024_c0_g1_i1:44-376(-)